MQFLFWNENALICHVTWEILLASCRGERGCRTFHRIIEHGMFVMHNSICCIKLPRETAACSKAIPVIKGLVSQAAITEIPLSKYLVDLIITLVPCCMVSSEFGDIVFKRRVGFFTWTWV